MNPIGIAPDTGQALEEFARVEAIELITEGDRIMPKGSTGTIVHVYDHGAAYEVEFTAPKHAVIFARREQLARR